VLLLLLGGGVVLFLRRQAPGIVRGPAWDCGFIAAPHHLPFGDPATQVSAAGMAQPLRRMLGKTLLADAAVEVCFVTSRSIEAVLKAAQCVHAALSLLGAQGRLCSWTSLCAVPLQGVL
jgi:hypothetical protein